MVGEVGLVVADGRGFVLRWDVHSAEVGCGVDEHFLVHRVV